MEVTIFEAYLNPIAKMIFNEIQIEGAISDAMEDIRTRLDNYSREMSGLTIKSFEEARVHIAKNNPLGRKHEDLPKFIVLKHCVVNMKNQDNRCFECSVLSALHPPATHANKTYKYEQYRGELNFDGIDFPVGPGDIARFEELNQININVYRFYDEHGKERAPYLNSQLRYNRTIDLLYWREHYAWIKNFGRFMAVVTMNHRRKWFCKKCFGHMTTEALLLDHDLYCKIDGPIEQLIKLPPPPSILEFKNFARREFMPFVGYADSESKLRPIPRDAQLNTNLYQRHETCSIAMKVVCRLDPQYSEPYKQFFGESCISSFLDKLQNVVERVKRLLSQPVPLPADCFQNYEARFQM